MSVLCFILGSRYVACKRHTTKKQAFYEYFQKVQKTKLLKIQKHYRIKEVYANFQPFFPDNF